MGRIVIGEGGGRRALAAELGRRWPAAEGWRSGSRPVESGRPADALVWLASPAAPAAEERRSLAAALDQVRPAHLVVVTSAEVFEPHAHHPGLVAEEHPVSRRSGNPVAARWREVEDGVRRVAAERELRLTLLRTPPVPLGDGEKAVDPWNRLLGSSWVGVPVGFDPVLQFLHPEDLASALERVIGQQAGEAGGERPEVFHLAPTAPVPCRRGLALAGVRCLPMPRGWLVALGRRGGFRRKPHPDFLRHPWTLAAERAREHLGWSPRYSSASAVAAASGVPREGEGRRTRLLRHLGDWDDFGLDPAFVRWLSRTVFRFLHQVWHRVEVAGLEGVPETGPAVLAGVHRGFVPLDAMLALHEISGGWRQGRDASPRRIPRFLVHPGLLKAPFVAPLVTRLGGVPANQRHLGRLLARGEMVGVFPEGVHGAFSRYRNAYRVRRFLSADFLRSAAEHDAPVVPFVTLGSAEAFPVVGVVRWSWWKRTMEWPYIPLTPTFPWLPPLPLPVKWHTLYLPSMDAGSAPEPAVGRELRHTLQVTLDDLRARRRSWWRGRIFVDGLSG